MKVSDLPYTAFRAHRNKTARRNYAAKMRGVAVLVPAKEARAHVRALHAGGMSSTQIAEASGYSRDRIVCLISQLQDHSMIQRLYAEDLLAVQYQPPTRGGTGARQDATGTIRRLQGLLAGGIPLAVPARHLGRTVQHLWTLSTGTRPTVVGATAFLVAQAYDAIAGAPLDKLGVEPWVADRTKRRAAQLGYVSWVYWDSDTIDDPAAHPDFTGECGTARGLWLHEKYEMDIRDCPACLEFRRADKRRQKQRAKERQRDVS